MRYLSIQEIEHLHERIIRETGGTPGLLDRGRLEASANQPHQMFGGRFLYPSLLERAVVLAFGLAMNNAFVDGNKRVAHAALETTLVMNGWELKAAVDELERLFLDLADGQVTREQMLIQVEAWVVPLGKEAD